MLKPYNLSEGEIRSYLLDLRNEVSWNPGADFGDFESVVFRAGPSAPQTPKVEVVVDESALPKFLDDGAPPRVFEDTNDTATRKGGQRRKRSALS